jgi:hypothetical protein
MTPQPLPPEQIKTPRGIGINEGEGGARKAEAEYLYDGAFSNKRGRWTDDGTGHCLNCRREAPAHGRGERCPVGPRVLRHFVNRGGELVEVESVVRETRG